MRVSKRLLVHAGAKKIGLKVGQDPFFDTVKVEVSDAELICKKATDHGVNLRPLDVSSVTISLDETTTIADIDQLLFILNNGNQPGFKAESLAEQVKAFPRTQKSIMNFTFAIASITSRIVFKSF